MHVFHYDFSFSLILVSYEYVNLNDIMSDDKVIYAWVNSKLSNNFLYQK